MNNASGFGLGNNSATGFQNSNRPASSSAGLFTQSQPLQNVQGLQTMQGLPSLHSAMSGVSALSGLSGVAGNDNLALNTHAQTTGSAAVGSSSNNLPGGSGFASHLYDSYGSGANTRGFGVGSSGGGINLGKGLGIGANAGGGILGFSQSQGGLLARNHSSDSTGQGQTQTQGTSQAQGYLSRSGPYSQAQTQSAAGGFGTWDQPSIQSQAQLQGQGMGQTQQNQVQGQSKLSSVTNSLGGLNVNVNPWEQTTPGGVGVSSTSSGFNPASSVFKPNPGLNLGLDSSAGGSVGNLGLGMTLGNTTSVGMNHAGLRSLSGSRASNLGNSLGGLGVQNLGGLGGTQQQVQQQQIMQPNWLSSLGAAESNSLGISGLPSITGQGQQRGLQHQSQNHFPGLGNTFGWDDALNNEFNGTNAGYPYDQSQGSHQQGLSQGAMRLRKHGTATDVGPGGLANEMTAPAPAGTFSSAPLPGADGGPVNGEVMELDNIETGHIYEHDGRKFEIRDVWRNNLDEEMRIIRRIIVEYNYIAMDTEFPGVVARPTGPFAENDYNYQFLRCNVDLLNLIQLGIAFADKDGNFATKGAGKLGKGSGKGEDDAASDSEDADIYCCCWQFHFKFSLTDDMYAQDSIDLLKRSGINFELHETNGIEVEDFGELLTSSGLVLVPEVHWISFHGSFDFGYLLKVLTSVPLPEKEEEFFQLLKIYFPNVYDIKYIMKQDFSGGLNKLADLVEARRIGPEHQAGSDSLLTLSVFFNMRKRHFDGSEEDFKERCGIIHGIGSTGNGTPIASNATSMSPLSVRNNASRTGSPVVS